MEKKMEKMNYTDNKIKHSLIDKAIDALELFDIYIYSSSLSRHDDDCNINNEEIAQQNKLVVKCAKVISVEEVEYVRAIVSFGARFIKINDGEDIILAEIEASFVAEYKLKKEVNDDAISEFVKYNAVHHVWPFWREFAFTTAMSSNIPKPNIPFRKYTK